jgi:hypothetical protein
MAQASRATSQAEAAAAQQARQQQRKIEELERRLEAQSKFSSRGDERGGERMGGTSSEHLGQAVAHAQRAIALALKGLWPCGSASGSASAQVADASYQGMVSNRSGKQTPPKKHPLESIPSWQSQSELYALKHDGELSQLGLEQVSNKAWASDDVLRDHEYVLEDEFETAKTAVINPKSKWKESWDIGVLMFILYSAVVVPFRICFSAEAVDGMWNFEVGISLFFIVDVLFNFNTAYLVDDKWVISRPRIIGRYLSGERASKPPPPCDAVMALNTEPLSFFAP